MSQVAMALLYYLSLILLVRLAGKRLAGQTTTFDLLVLIGLGVTLQEVMLDPGKQNALIFCITVFATHLALARACARWKWLRVLVRGGPRPLVRNGQILEQALRDEGMSVDELKAGLRKLGYETPDEVDLAVLEETGHITAIKK
jgi:uncharacterized membrane protein YcaP (DUF421 family)